MERHWSVAYRGLLSFLKSVRAEMLEDEDEDEDIKE